MGSSLSPIIAVMHFFETLYIYERLLISWLIQIWRTKFFLILWSINFPHINF